MTIDPTSAHEKTFAGRAAWSAGDFESRGGLTTPIPAAVLRDLDDGLASIQRQGKRLETRTGRREKIGTVTSAGQELVDFQELSGSAADCPSIFSRLPATDFHSKPLTAFTRTVRRDLLSGCGFVILRGLPIARYSPDEAGIVYGGIGSALGVTLPQNAKGERLYSVRNEGYSVSKDYGASGVRYSKTTEPFHFHTDSAPNLAGPAPDIIGLLAIQTAKSGGESVLVSAQSTHNILLAEHRPSLEQLYRPLHYDRTAEWQPGEPRTLVAPVFRFERRLQMRYMRFYIEQGHARAGAPLTSGQTAALDHLDAVMDRPGQHLRIALKAGDMLFLNNHLVLHSRTAFEDHPEPERRRHYVRMWLATPQDA